MTRAEKLVLIEENQPKVYESGVKSEHDKFWDRYQKKGDTNYAVTSGYFNGAVFGSDNFYPKHDICPVGNASFLFYAWENRMGDHKGFSLKQRLKECGVVLEPSKK